MKSLTTIVAALALGSLAFAADEKPAQPPGDKPRGPGGDKPRPNPEEAFAKLDADKSGDISLVEFQAGPRAQKDPAKAEEYYKKMDANSDGKLTLEEFKAGRGGPGGPGGGDRKGPRPDAPKPQ
jgi:EF-hand domain pair